MQKDPFVENPLLSKALPLNPGVPQNMAIVHASPTARNFFLSDFYPLGPFGYIIFQISSLVFLALGVANACYRVGPRNENE